MKATIVTITKDLAKDYLKRNIQNRKINTRTLKFYKNQMLSGKWKENGEPIIIDTNGVIKDGQHRLMAVAETGYAFKVPVISGISPEVMDTIDTGRNRTAADVLYLEGFKYASLMASGVKLIIADGNSSHNSKKIGIGNNDILNFAKKYKSYLYELIKLATDISSLQVARVLTTTTIVYILHKYGNNQDTQDFIKNILGITRTPKTATDYVYKKLFRSYNGEERLNQLDKKKYIEKAYEYYSQGNPIVKYVTIEREKGVV